MRSFDQGAGDADALLLASTQVDPTFSKHGVKPVLKSLYVLPNTSVMRSLAHLLIVSVALAKRDVAADGVAEQEDILRDVAQILLHGVKFPFGKGGVVQGDAALLGVHHAHGQLQHRGFSAAGAARDA